jgi:hypothetical protein
MEILHRFSRFASYAPQNDMIDLIIELRLLTSPARQIRAGGPVGLIPKELLPLGLGQVAVGAAAGPGLPRLQAGIP